MGPNFPYPQESFMLLILILRKALNRRLSALILLSGMLVSGMCASISLPAQQAEVDNPPTTLLIASTAAPTQDAGPQAPAAPAQSTPGTTAPDPNNPNSQSPASENSNGDQSPQQTKRILDVIPNFRSVSTQQKLPPQSVKEKFVTCTQDSFDYSSIFVPAVLAVYDLEISATPEFHSGPDGYARYLWHSAVDQTSENYMVEFVFPSITHEDTRYYTMGSGGFIKRTGYALSRAIVTRTDSGNNTFNFSEVIGAGASAGISNLYYPSASRSLSNTGTQWGLDIAIDAASFWFREFWPDINHRLFHSSSAANSVNQ